MKQHNLPNLHWNDDDLLDRLYGLDAPAGKDASHLDTCEDCRLRWQALALRRSQLTAAPVAVSEAGLRAQREKIWARAGEANRTWIWRAVPAAATAMMLMVGVALHTGPLPEAPSQKMAMTQQASPEVTDDQLFREIASIATADEPSSAATLHHLFDSAADGAAQ